MTAAPMTTAPSAIDEQIDRVNATDRTPVVFIHGLWLLPSSWDRWAAAFDEAGFVALTPGWPDDPETVEEANAHPEVFAHKKVGQVADHYADVIGKLDKKPAVIGHSFGGLLTQIVAGRGLSAASVAIAGLASGVVNTSFMMGGAVGLAILASLAASRSDSGLASSDGSFVALNSGYHLAFLVGAVFIVAAAAVGAALLRTTAPEAASAGEPAPASSH